MLIIYVINAYQNSLAVKKYRTKNDEEDSDKYVWKKIIIIFQNCNCIFPFVALFLMQLHSKGKVIEVAWFLWFTLKPGFA